MSSAQGICNPGELKPNLTPRDKEVAFNDLREDDLIKEQSLEQMRDWIRKHPAIKKCRTDSPFLLRFLRTRKYSVPRACEFLERYIATRQMYPKRYKNLNFDDPIIQELINCGYIIALPTRDVDNRRIVLDYPGRYDPHKYSSDDLIRTYTMVNEFMMDDALNQIYGYTQISDYSNFTMAHSTVWSLAELKIAIKCAHNLSPRRNKRHHIINVSPFSKHLMEFGFTLLKDKLRSRITIYKNVEEFKPVFDTSILPRECGGEIPLADMIDDFKKELAAANASYQALDDMEIDLNCGYKLKSINMEELGGGMIGSFRKLEVD